MIRVLLVLLLFLSACTKQNSKPENPTSPQKYSDIPELEYSSDENNIVLTEESSLRNYSNISLAPETSSSINLKIKALNSAGEIFSIRNINNLTIPQNCIKSYTANEECVFSIQIGPSANGVFMIRAATSKGPRFFLLKIKRTNIGIPQIIVNNGQDLNFDPVGRSENAQKVVVIKNNGNAPANNLQISLEDRDAAAYRIIQNTCKNLMPMQSCSVRLLISSNSSGIGTYLTKLRVQGDNISPVVSNPIQAEVVSSVLTNEPPVIQNIGNKTIGAEDTLKIQVQATDNDSESLSYSYESSTVVGSINSSTGEFEWTPALNQQGIHQIKFKVSDGASAAVEQNIQVEVFPRLSLSGTSFTEGDVLDPLMTMTFNGPRQVQSISTNISNAFSVVYITGTGTVGGANAGSYLFNNTNFPVGSIYTSNISYNLAGAAKFRGHYDINFNVTFSDGKSHSYVKKITINPGPLAVVRYDIWAVKFTGDTGYSGPSIYQSIAELKREWAGWKNPIMVRFRHQPIICGSTEMTDFDASQQNQLECLREMSSDDAESAFFFRRVYYGTSQIGGIANGTRDSLVVERSPWSHTLAHELGHQFGLWHTFESYWNDNVFHCSSTNTSNNISSCFNYPLYYDHLNAGLDTVQDWSNYKVDFFGAGGISFFNYGAINDDTPYDFFNAQATSLYTTACFAPGLCVNNATPPYNQGVTALIYKGGQSYSSPQGSFACYQDFTSSTPYLRPVRCPNLPGLGSIVLDENATKNTMSYWYRDVGEARFTPGQKQRMQSVLNFYPELSETPNFEP